MGICKFVLLCVLVLTFAEGDAQSHASIHLQSSQSRQYSVQWNGNNYSSTEQGYLEIPNVPAGDQLLILGFPGNAYPATAFTCTITDKPRGFALKLGVDNSWSLFDMVELYTMRGVPAAGLKITKPAPPELAATPAPVKQEPKQKGSNIRKLFDKAGPDGIDQVYLIENNGKTDTVALFIPVLEEVKPRQTAFEQWSKDPDLDAGMLLFAPLDRYATLDPRNHVKDPLHRGC